jgi:dephospho-CoA kinase
MKTHKIFLVVGSFGVGKTTVCSAYPKHVIADTFKLRLSNFNNLYVYGYNLRGLDSLNDSKRPVSKQALATDLALCTKQNFLLHGTFYQYRTDIVNFSQTHELHVLYLVTDLETNIERLRGRNPRFDEPKTRIRITAKHREVASFIRSCEESNVIIHRIDANQSAAHVKSAAWKLILKNLTK